MGWSKASRFPETPTHLSHAPVASGEEPSGPVPKNSSSRSSALLELVHSDVLGPVKVPSVCGTYYFVAFIHDFSKWTILFPMMNKSDSFECIKKFHKEITVILSTFSSKPLIQAGLRLCALITAESTCRIRFEHTSQNTVFTIISRWHKPHITMRRLT